jgi:electron transfer flavoprotein beta subunit
LSLESFKIDLKQSLKLLKTEAPPVRQGGTILDSVDTLIDKLRNEAKVLS